MLKNDPGFKITCFAGILIMLALIPFVMFRDKSDVQDWRKRPCLSSTPPRSASPEVFCDEEADVMYIRLGDQYTLRRDADGNVMRCSSRRR